MKTFYVYILASDSMTLYTGVTSNITKRIYEHKNGLVEGFTSKYKVHRLVYLEETNDVHAAIAREKQIKGWTRARKIALVNSVNQSWNDLSEEF
ncbi:MAG: GIY-YIG nuclease family protein [Nitrospirae bacterium]|nr:GIY-YIG nuclease family protein [Nitrospirota bacterium]MBI5694494.1 GIY-YIG nuclease family protein [Nitrospirota bacterium]